MLFRFSLYGFLKNQQYYAPFIILAFMDKGLSFFQIGILFAAKAFCINLLEIPSGAIADLYGRRRSMVFSFAVYMVAFGILAFFTSFWPLLAGMVFLGVGDSFRTGTHKAMIFDWLEKQGRIHERTKVYGYTRSWSKMGSAVATWIGVGAVWFMQDYSSIFWLCILPYTLGIINFLGYPDFLNQRKLRAIAIRQMFIHLKNTIREAWKVTLLRQALLEASLFEGGYSAVADYLQPVAKQAVLSLPVLVFLPGYRRTALMVGIFYFILYVISSMVARRAYLLENRLGGEKYTTNALWKIYFIIFILMTLLLIFKLYVLACFGFVALAVLQNLWRPVTISRINAYSTPENNATLLSLESQAKSLFLIIAAPLLGFVLDELGLWPLGVFGLVIFTCVSFSRRGL